jgi:23S rRNA (cytidine1920-2'-O)/16S rRNA (cytidine1409-2'-O)-methyltransferase
LAWKIRSDTRVEVREGLNARMLSPQSIGTLVQLAVVDVSFISLTLILPPMFACVETGGVAIALIKPQFELQPNQVGKGGIVREEELRMSSVRKIQLFVVEQLHREWLGVMESPITGAKGNREFLACLR